MNQTRVLHSPFDIDTHKKTFINYLEVVILEDGTIQYAVPSHQEKTIAIAMVKQGVTRQELEDLCPPSYYFDFMTWLCKMAGTVSLWNEHMIGEPNEMQRQSIQELKDAELYHGKIPTL